MLINSTMQFCNLPTAACPTGNILCKPAFALGCGQLLENLIKRQRRLLRGEGPPEGPHGHAKAGVDGHVDLVGVQAQVDQQACGLGVRKEHAVHRKACAVAHHNRRLLDGAAVLQCVQHHLNIFSASSMCR